MWLVSSDGEWLGGKRVWLRPGAGYLFGRTTGKALGPSGEQVNYIDHTAVSRKHLIIQIAQVKPGDSARIHTKTTVTVTDGSKSGTEINGTSLMGKSMTLDGTKFKIKLGKSPVYLILEWHPVVLTFASIPKSAKINGTALAAERQKLEPLDIKLVTEYVTGKTTHVVVKKRNTAPGLQALVEGRWVVTSSYVDALAAVAENDALELDYDGAWPSEADHICPKGEEPDPCPDDWLKPNPDRAEVFSGFTFLTLASNQHSNLMPIITAGGGKAFCYEFTEHETTARHVIEYVKEMAGKKDSRAYLLSQEALPGGIVLIRPTEKSASRTQPILSEVDTALNQRSIEQGELLGAVLRVDASMLRQPLREVTQVDADLQDVDGPVPARAQGLPSASMTASSPVDLPPQSSRGNPPTRQDTEARNEGQAAPPERPRRRMITQKQFKGFDDFDDDQIVRGPSQHAPPSHQPSQPQNEDQMDVSQNAPRSSDTQRRPQKRPAPVEEEEEDETEEQRFDRLLPGRAAMKRQKTEAAAKAKKSVAKPTPAPEESPVKTADKPKSKGKGKGKAKVDPNADLKAKMIAHTREQEEQRRKETEPIDMTEEEMNMIEAQIVTFELPQRPARPAPIEIDAENGVGGDPRWEGRANFKKFRRKGSKQPRKSDSQESQDRVIVALAEVPAKGHGLGDDYWLENGDTNQDSQSQSQATNSAANNTSFARGDNDEEERAAFRRRIRRSREEDNEAASAEAAFDRTAQSGGTQSTLATDTQRKAAGKRPATTELSGPAKKARQTTATSSRYANASDDDDDPRAFKRKRR